MGAEKLNGEKVLHWTSPTQQKYPPTEAIIVAPLATVVRAVLTCSDLRLEALRGNRQSSILVHARSAVAVLAQEFAPRTSLRAIEDALCRGAGLANWYIERSADREKNFPEYGVLLTRTRAYLRGELKL